MITCVKQNNIQESTGDGVFDVAGGPIYVYVNGQVQLYEKRRYVTNGVVTEVWVDSAGVESSALPAGAYEIPRDLITYNVTSTPSTGGTVSLTPIMTSVSIPSLLDNTDSGILTFDMGLDPAKNYFVWGTGYADLTVIRAGTGVTVIAANNMGVTLPGTSITLFAVEIV